MSQCSIEDLSYIKHIISNAFDTQDEVQLNDLESQISDLVIDNFTFKEYRDNEEIINTLRNYGVDVEGYFEGDTQSYSLKSNVVKNISTYHTDDLFKGIPVARSYFDRYLNNLIVKEAFIGSKDINTYVSSDIELSNNFTGLKNKLFLDIQTFLSKKGILTTDPVNLYNEKGGVSDYNYYKVVMDMISDYFFNENALDLITYSTNSVPNLNIDLEQNEDIFNAYNNAIILSNFDSIINTTFSSIIEINYNYFNNLNSVIGDVPKYKLVISPNSLLYWNEDTHESKSSESKEDRMTRMIINSIPLYNRKNQRKADFLEFKDMYLLAATISDFELLYGNALKNRDIEFKYFNEDPYNSLYWYIDEVKKAINADEDYIPEILQALDYNNVGSRYSLKSAIHVIYSLDNFLNDPELNIKAKEQTSNNSLVSMLTQVISNNYGASYSVFDLKEGWKLQKMYSQDFNSTSVNNTILEYLKSNYADKSMYDLKNKVEKDKFDNIFSTVKDTDLDVRVAFDNDPDFASALKNYLSEKTGIGVTNSLVNGIIDSMLDFNSSLDHISINFFKNKLQSFIFSLNKDFKSANLRNAIRGISTLTAGKLIKNTVGDAFYKAFTEAYLADEVVKPIMNIDTAAETKVPSFRTATLSLKDAELFNLQREFQDTQNGYFKSLLLGNNPVILGTATRLEAINGDESKKAVKLTPNENFIADFRYDFLESIVNNNTFQIMLGNYSDKTSIVTKIINANFTLDGDTTPLVKKGIWDILNVVKSQGLAYYTDTFIKIFSDYKELLDKTGFDTSSLIVEGFDSDSFENNIKFINSILAENTMDSLLSKYADLPYFDRDPNLSIMEEMHYSKYSDGVYINQYLADNYRIFSDPEKFRLFVAWQERILQDKIQNSDNKLKLPKATNTDYNKWANALRINEKEFKGSSKDTIVLEDNSLNPFLRKWLWLNAAFRNEYLYITAKGEYIHPHKDNSIKYRQGDFNLAYQTEYLKEGNKRLATMGKRNIIHTATIETPVRNSKRGVPNKINLAAIKDFTAEMYTPSGYTKDQEVHDGASLIDDTYSRMLSASFPGKGYRGTMKQFGSLITRNGITIKKDAESVITNERIRMSLNSDINLLYKKEQMLGIPLSDIDLDYSKTFVNQYFFNFKGNIYRITNIELKGDNATIGVQLKIGENSWIPQEPIRRKVNTLYDIWDAVGGIYSVDSQGNFNEGSNELLYDIVTSSEDGVLKNKIIHVISNKSSLKSGASNLNARKYWTNSKPLLFTTYDNRFMGPQLDASHGIDSSEIKEVTQLTSSLAQNGFTNELATEVYDDIAKVIRQSAAKYIDGLQSDNANLYKYLTDKFIQTVHRSRGESIAKNLIDSIKEDNIKIPFSNPNFFNLFVKDVIVRLNDEFITRYYSGIGSVLIPSHGMIQLYDVPGEDGITRVATAEDLLKEALTNYNEQEFISKYGALPTDNKQILDDYIGKILPNKVVTVDEIEIGDTVLSGDEQITLDTPRKYYSFKNSFADKKAEVIKVQSKPRDLKPTLHTFEVNGEKRNIFDLTSVKLLFKLKELRENFGKGIDYSSDTDVALLNNFIQYISNSAVDISTLDPKENSTFFNLVENSLRNFIQREFQLLDRGLTLNITDNLSEIFGNDNFTGKLDDHIIHYRLYSTPISNLQFRPAEKMLGDIYQSNFGRDINDSMYEIDKQGPTYFKQKLAKYYEKDDTDADLKLYTSKSENPIYIKYVDELGPLDRSINIKSINDPNNDLRKIPVRFNELGEEVYSIVNPNQMRVSTDENGKEFIYVKFGSYFRGNKQKGYHKYSNFESDLNKLLKSFRGSLQAVIPLMNRDAEPVDIFTYEKNKSGKSVISNTVPFNLNAVTANIFKRYVGFNVFLDNHYDQSWFEINKDDILDKISKSMFVSWQKSHELVDSRIPGQSMQSFMPMRNVAYIKTKTNDSYVSALQIYLQGSDFDIDKAYTLGFGFSNDGKVELWTGLSNYSTLEQLNELLKLPTPTGKELKLSDTGFDITEDYLAIAESLNGAEFEYELPVSTIYLFNNVIRKINDLPDSVVSIKQEHPTLSIDRFMRFMNSHNLYREHLRMDSSIKNAVVSRIMHIAAAPSNQIITNTPVSVQNWRDAIKLIEERGNSISSNVREADQNNLILDLSKLLSPYDIISYYTQQYDASIGKEDTGIAANGIKVFYALSNYYNSFYENLNSLDVLRDYKFFNKRIEFRKNGETIDSLSHTFNTIADVQTGKLQDDLYRAYNENFYVRHINAANMISELLSAATDNAKELLLGKINAQTDLFSMHLYLATLGYSITDIVEIMTSDIMQDIVNEKEINIFYTNKPVSMETVFKKLKNKYTNAGDLDKAFNIDTYKDIYDSSKELSTLAMLLGVNQRRKANTWELYNYLNRMPRLFINAERRVMAGYTEYQKATKGAKRKDYLINRIFELNQHLNQENSRDLEYVTSIINEAESLNITDGKFDFEKYFSDDHYKEISKSYYNLIKYTFNVFDVLDSIPHFKEMVNSLVLSHNIISKYSRKYNFIFNEYRNVLDIFSVNEDQIRMGIAYYDAVAREQWLKSEELLKFNFNLKDLMRMSGKDTFTLYTSADAMKNSKKEENSILVELEDDSNPIITLTSLEGIANFKSAVEKLMLPILQSTLKENNIFKLDNSYNTFRVLSSIIAPKYPLSSLNVPTLIKGFQKSLNTFNDLDRKINLNSRIKNNVGEYIKWRDILYVYNLIVNNDRYGDKRLTPLMQDYLKDKNTLGYDFIKFSSNLDNGLDFYDPENGPSDIDFYANSKEGVLHTRQGIIEANNPDFSIVVKINQDPQARILNNDINEVLRILKEGGFIINLKC